MGILWSVIIPTYNREKLLRRAVESVLQQSTSDFELVIVDDASNDNTPSYADALQDGRVRYIRLAENKGAADARNAGLAAAAGDFVAFLDSDDVWLPRKLEACRQLALDNGPHGRWMGFHRVRIEYHRGYYVAPSSGLAPRETVGDYILGTGFIQTSALFGPRQFFLEVGFTRGMRNLEDWDFYLKAFESGGALAYLDEVLAVHHAETRNDRISRALDPAVAEDWLAQHHQALSPRSRNRFKLLRLAPALKRDHPWQARALALRAGVALLPDISHTWRPLASILFRARSRDVAPAG